MAQGLDLDTLLDLHSLFWRSYYCHERNNLSDLKKNDVLGPAKTESSSSLVGQRLDPTGRVCQCGEVC